MPLQVLPLIQPRRWSPGAPGSPYPLHYSWIPLLKLLVKLGSSGGDAVVAQAAGADEEVQDKGQPAPHTLHR